MKIRQSQWKYFFLCALKNNFPWLCNCCSVLALSFSSKFVTGFYSIWLLYKEFFVFLLCQLCVDSMPKCPTSNNSVWLNCINQETLPISRDTAEDQGIFLVIEHSRILGHVHTIFQQYGLWADSLTSNASIVLQRVGFLFVGGFLNLENEGIFFFSFSISNLWRTVETHCAFKEKGIIVWQVSREGDSLSRLPC